MTAMGFLVAQVPIPTDGQGAWMWVAILLGSALAYLFKLWLSDINEGRRRERDQTDKLTATLPEIVSLFREWKEANNGRPPSRES